jgi:23S rRNA (uracil1939-C5)-methyltransferase
MEWGESYEDWKLGLVNSQLARAGIERRCETLATFGPGLRRRAILTARRTKKAVMIGFFRFNTHEVVNIEECPVLLPAIVAALEPLRVILRFLLSRRSLARIAILATDNGLDIAIDDCKSVDDASLLAELANFARAISLARLSVNGETILELAPPLIRIGDKAVVPPPAAFVQAVQKAERAMLDEVLSLLPEARLQIADLFCGLGTFSLPLAERHEVTAIEDDKALLDALGAAVRASPPAHPPQLVKRDLFAMPLSRLELPFYDLALFDPPRGGAISQANEMAASALERIIAISCNPASFANDARALLAGGYEMSSLKAYDQFLWTPHVELVASFVK